MSRLIDLQLIPDAVEGDIVVLEAQRRVPFDFPRVFLLHQVPEGIVRGEHAHREQHQLLVAVAGAFIVTVEDRGGIADFKLDTPAVGLYAPPLTWVMIRSIMPDSSCMVLTSGLYDEADYIRDRAEFDRLLQA